MAGDGGVVLQHGCKSRILDAVTEAVDANAVSPLAALKQDAVVARAEQTLAGIHRLPEYLRTRGAVGQDELPTAAA
jgi:ParB family chromosome partitioning protein